jgi:hypothetical protein
LSIFFSALTVSDKTPTTSPVAFAVGCAKSVVPERIRKQHVSVNVNVLIFIFSFIFSWLMFFPANVGDFQRERRENDAKEREIPVFASFRETFACFALKKTIS